NRTPDSCDIAAGASDCNSNGIPDVCEIAAHARDLFPLDCNTNGLIDVCEIAAGANDCNSNGIPDACELAIHDCNSNGVLDSCDIVVGAPDCNTDGMPDTCDISTHSGPVRYDSGPVNLAIPDHNFTGVTSTINATLSGIVQDVNVTVHIQHPDVTQLFISLIHGSTSITLWRNNCAGAANLNVTFDDQSAATLDCGNLSGTYRSAVTGGGLLSSFNGQNAQGAWSLRVVDTTTGGVGTVSSWTMNVIVPNAPPTSLDANSNGIPDECEGNCTTCRGDFDGSHLVDAGDIQGFVGAYLAGTYNACADINHDNTISDTDLNAFISFLL